MPVYTKASRARLAARSDVDDAYDHDEDDQDFTLLWRGPSSVPPPSSRSSAPPLARRDRPSAAPAPRSERPSPPPARVTAPPPSFPAPQRTEMRAQAAAVSPEPPRMLELTVRERRWKIAVRASVLLGIGCIIGIGTEVLIQHRGGEVVPDPSTTSATFAYQGSSIATSAPPAPTPTQCMSASIAPSPLPPIENDGASIAHAVHHHHHRDRAADAPQGAPAADTGARPAAPPAEPVLPDDIAAAAAEALSKAQQETMLP